MIAEALAARRAIEALRAGVPNHEAVAALGCEQPALLQRFGTLLDAVEGAGDRQPPGLVLEGGFGAGKSHLLEHLRGVAAARRFVVSTVAVSKETPLHDPIRFYRAALAGARLPDRRGALLTEVAASLDFTAPAVRALLEGLPGLDPRFALTLAIYERRRHDPETTGKLVRFWAGENLQLPLLKTYARACGLAVPALARLDLKHLAVQRFTFAARLVQAAGYGGWILLVDEAELIGRYTLLQRARAYAAAGFWLGALAKGGVPGIGTVLALTDDFVSAVLEEREDLEKVPGKLQARGTETDLLIAGQAERGMRMLQKDRVALRPPDHAMLDAVYGRLRELHGRAFGWTPPDVPSVERLASTRMRQYVRGWITEWDLLRLDPAYQPRLEAVPLHFDYREDADLATPPEGDDEPGGWGS